MTAYKIIRDVIVFMAIIASLIAYHRQTMFNYELVLFAEEVSERMGITNSRLNMIEQWVVHNKQIVVLGEK